MFLACEEIPATLGLEQFEKVREENKPSVFATRFAPDYSKKDFDPSSKAWVIVLGSIMLIVVCGVEGAQIEYVLGVVCFGLREMEIKGLSTRL